MNQALKDKVALVMGGTRGIGAAIVRRLARDGAAVAFTYAASADAAHALAADIETEGGQALAIQADSANPQAVRHTVAQAAARFGRIDILVNNAGVLRLGAIDQMPLEDFDHLYNVNVRGLFVSVQSALAHMPDGGRIISIGSVASVRVAFPTSSGYAMSKGAVASLVRGMAIDLAPRRITVNNVQPGPVETDMNPGDGPHAEALKGMIPLHRVGQPDEIAAMVAYLAGAEAGYVTGASLLIDGGYSA